MKNLTASKRNEVKKLVRDSADKQFSSRFINDELLKDILSHVVNLLKDLQNNDIIREVPTVKIAALTPYYDYTIPIIFSDPDTGEIF